MDIKKYDIFTINVFKMYNNYLSICIYIIQENLVKSFYMIIIIFSKQNNIIKIIYKMKKKKMILEIVISISNKTLR